MSLYIILRQNYIFVRKTKIHVRTPGIPRPKVLGPRPRKRRPVGGGTFNRVFGAGYSSREWRAPSWQFPPRWGGARRGRPRWFANSPPRRPFSRTREPGHWRPRYSEEPPPVQRPRDWRMTPTPRRGSPVAAIRVPAGTCRWCGKRGGLVGMIPEALCGEAPKGQPVIRRENLVAF